MTFNREELRKLALPALVGFVLLGSGAGFIALAEGARRAAQHELAAAQADRAQNGQRLSRIAEEEREVKEKLEVYRNLKRLNILGEERRLEWADTMSRIRTQRELLDLRYRVERQKLLVSLPGSPGSVDFYASTMRVDLALLHEGDLFRFLADLRNSGNAYYSVKRCAVTRTGPAAATGTNIAPRLRADCDIDLVTVLDRGAKQ
jgi:hypothetical protein